MMFYSLTARNTSPQKQYQVDFILQEQNHTVLRLPPDICELNPIELAWAKLKREVRENRE